MKTEIELLKNHFGSYQVVAENLGVTERHLRNIMRNEHVGEPIKKLIQTMLKSLQASKLSTPNI